MVNGKWASMNGYYFYIILALTFFLIKVSYLSTGSGYYLLQYGI